MEESDLALFALLSIWIVGSVILVIALWHNHKGIKESQKARKEYIENLAKLQDWLFNQLYTIAPGKVLRPDEIEPKEESKKAVVINRNRDPMNEFTGKKDDWHE